MKFAFASIALSCLLFAACNKQANSVSTTSNSGKSGTTGDASAQPTGPALVSAAASDIPAGATPAPIIDGVANLTPENTKILFVGTHAGGNPNPRTGGFEKFTGQAQVDSASKTLKSLTVVIDTASLWTQIPRLTNHLTGPDFFDTREHPKARFESTRIQSAGADGRHTIAGNLTLLATTKEVSFPAKVNIDDRGLALAANFTIDRTEFGMDRLQDGVEKPVSLSALIGEKTQPLPPEGPPSGGRGPDASK